MRVPKDGGPEMRKKFRIPKAVLLGSRSESEAPKEDVEQYIRRRYFELRQQRGDATEQFIDRVANQEISLALSHELLEGAVSARGPIRLVYIRRWLARIRSSIGPPISVAFQTVRPMPAAAGNQQIQLRREA